MPAAARDRDFPALAASAPKWARDRIIKGVPRLAAADLDRLEDGPVRDDPPPDGPRAQILHLVLVQDPVELRVADSVPEWRTVRNYGRPVTCVPQRVRAMAIDRASLDGQDNSVRVSPDLNDHPHDQTCPAKWPASIDR